MFIKSLSRHTPSYQSLFDYLTKERNGVKPKTFSFNIRAKTMEGIIHEFIENEAWRKHPRKGNVFLYHTIISASNKDTVTSEILIEIAKKFIELNNPKTLYFCSIHEDTDAPHAHIMSSSVELFTGLACRKTKQEFNNLKVELQEFHAKFPELANSNCNFIKHPDRIKNFDNYNLKRKDMKAEIKKTVNACLDKATTQLEFLDYLREAGFHHYERKLHQPVGILDAENQKYRFSSLIDMDKFNALPSVSKEEQQMLREIDDVRNARDTQTPNKYLTFEENGVEKTIVYNNDFKAISWTDSDGTTHHEESELSEKDRDSYDRIIATMDQEMELTNNFETMEDSDQQVLYETLVTPEENDELMQSPYNPLDYDINSLKEFDEYAAPEL
jgi:hypothetical protein